MGKFLLLLLLAGLAVKASAAPPVPVVVSSTPQAREPQSAIAGNTVYVVWGADDTVYCAMSLNAGKTYGAPVKVAVTRHLALGMRRGPRIAATKNGAVITAVYGTQGGGADGNLVAWRTSNQGRTWSKPVVVSDVPGAAREGLHAMAAAPSGAIACAWLDLRLPGTGIMLSVSRDGGKTWGRNTWVYRSPDKTVCECCHPSLAYDGQGQLWVMWRNWLGGARDMYLTHSHSGEGTFTTAQKLGRGTWPLNACPMDGGGLAVSPSGAVTTFWRREGTLYRATPGQAEVPLVKGEQGWATGTSHGPYLVWLAQRHGAVLTLLPGQSTPMVLGGDGDDPAISASEKGLVVAVWKSKRGIEAVRLDNKLPQKSEVGTKRATSMLAAVSLLPSKQGVVVPLCSTFRLLR